MKKLFILLLMVALVMPVVVKADIEHIHTYYNKELIVEGQLEVHIPLLYDKEYNFTINYDSTMLKTDNSMITINQDTYLTVENGSDNPVEKNNIIQANVEDGKATIKVKMTDSCCIAGDSFNAILTIRLTALKEGETKVEISDDQHDVIGEPSVIIKGNNSKDNSDTKEPTTTIDETKECNENNTLFIVSLVANGLLLVSLIAVLITKKKVNN